MAETPSHLPAGWCGALAPSATGGSPHHCARSAGHAESLVDVNVDPHVCPCGVWWAYQVAPTAAAVDTRCPVEHGAAGQCVLVAGHQTRHCADAGNDRRIWWFE